MKTQIAILCLMISLVLAQHEHGGTPPTGRPEFSIQGIPAEALAKLHDAMKKATNMEQRKAAITEWENGLPSDQQAIAKAFFEKMEQQHAAADH